MPLELRNPGLLPLLVLHLAAESPSNGNRLRRRIATVTGGILEVNPNTMYPLLRRMELEGLLEGVRERSQCVYSVTAAGLAERDRLARELAPRLEAVARAVDQIRNEVLGAREVWR